MSTMLEPETKPNPTKEIVHQSKGCLAVLVAAAVLIFGGYFVWNQTTGLLAGIGEPYLVVRLGYVDSDEPLPPAPRRDPHDVITIIE